MFNKNYRYNYKFNNSTIVTNVLFVDSVQQQGTDTIYSLNRIGVTCLSVCPTPSQNPSATIIWPNMPQFLQRNIKKFNTGLVGLYDTTKIVIIPTCTIGQTWLFDSLYNKPATCTSNSTQTIFGISDSVKTILINNIDTLKLSKSFGIIVFPDPYGKNKYYRLSGIESKLSYDSTSLFGEKVPNAWDFYNYNVGDVFCSISNSFFVNTVQLTVAKRTITGKTIVASGYNYTYSEYYFSQVLNFIATCSFPWANSFTLNTSAFTCTNLSSPTLLENFMYPNKIVKPPVNFQPTPTVNGFLSIMVPNISKFGLDNNNRFYKYMGSASCNYTTTVVPGTGEPGSLTNYGTYYSENTSGDHVKTTFGVGFGLVSQDYFYFESGGTYNLTNAVKNGITYFGPPNTLGIKNYDLENKNLIAYPNPVHSTLNLNITERSTVRLFNGLGEQIHKSVIDPGNTIDTSSFPAGIYILLVETNQGSCTQKLVIEH